MRAEGEVYGVKPGSFKSRVLHDWTQRVFYRVPNDSVEAGPTRGPQLTHPEAGRSSWFH
jgi:hypothetical protein